jgi:hypothetical protein
LVVPVKLEGMELFLIDTPSFDDPEPGRSRLDILHEIADILVSHHKRGITLRGAVYVHPVTEGVTERVEMTFNIVRKIVGGGISDTLTAFSQWSRVMEVEGVLKENELKSHPGALQSEILYWRFLGDRASAVEVAKGIRHLHLWSGNSLYEEIIYKNLPIDRTSAGAYINSLSDAITTNISTRSLDSSIWGMVPPIRVEEAPRSSDFATRYEEEMQATAELFVRTPP